MFQSWSRVRRHFVTLLCALFALWTLDGALGGIADARPGGGQNYRAPSRAPSSSPSRSSSSSSSSSHTYSPPVRHYDDTPTRRYDDTPTRRYDSSPSSGSTVVYVGPRSSSSDGCGGFGALAVLILVVILIYFYWSSTRKSQKEERDTISTDVEVAESGLQALRKQDPEFDPAAFLARTRSVVAKVNEAWLGGSMDGARRVISDGVYVRFATQLGLLKADGLKNCMADWRVVSAELLAAEADPLWDTIHVKVVGAARDLDVELSLSDEKAKRKVASAPLAEYQEVWSFVRRRGKLTKKGVPGLEGRCPSCGADMPLSAVVKCEYCKALVNSGEHDWVLAEITQPEEWRAGAALGEIPGLADLRQRDPSVSRQELEDRASVIFWKWVEARSSGQPHKLARFCLKPLVDDASRAPLGLTPTKLRQVAVGSAETRSLSQDGTLDHAVIELRWSAAMGDGKEPEFQLHNLRLARQATALSKRGLSSLDCPECGGQLAASDAVTCSYCGAPLTGGKHEWALESVEAGEAPLRPPLDDGSGGSDDGPGPSGTGIAALGIGLALADVALDIALSAGSNSSSDDDDD